MVNLSEILAVSEEKAEQTSGEAGSLSVGAAASHTSDAQIEPVTSSLWEGTQELAHGSADLEAPGVVPERDAAGEMPEIDAPGVDVPVAEVPMMAEVPMADLPRADVSMDDTAAHVPNPKIAEADAPHVPGKVFIMSSGDRGWADNAAGSEPEAAESQGMFGKRRLAALAAVVALATVMGVLGGALATVALTHLASDDAMSGNNAFEATVARIDADILALKAGLEHTSKLSMSQFNKTSDRLDKLEKLQAEPAAKIAKLSEAVDKLRAAPAASPASVVSAKDVTGTVSPPAATAPKAEVGKLPSVEGWVLREVAHGGAMIESRQGMFEVYAGDFLPGLGRIDAVRRQDGRWVVVTSKGLIVAR
jgi:hypothetical protein